MLIPRYTNFMEPEKLKVTELEKILKEYELNRLHTDVIEKIIILIIASLCLITALAWDTALASLFKKLFGGKQTLIEEMSYALVITIIAAVVSVLISRSLRRKKSKNLSKLGKPVHNSIDTMDD